MKKFVFIFLFILIVQKVFSESADIRFIFADGSEYTNSFDNESKVITLISDEKFRRKELVDIKGLEQFENLTDFCMYFFHYQGDYSFLKDIKKLKKLGLINCGAESLYFLEDLIFLEDFEVELDVRNENQNKIENNEIDLGKLQYLKSITISLQYMREFKFIGYMRHLPPFVNVKNKPILKIYAQDIKELSEKDYEYSKQYSQIQSNYPYENWPFD